MTSQATEGGDATPKKKDCSTCGEPIPASARKCRACGSYQDWRSVVTVSNTALALLTALVSVIATTIPVIKDFNKFDDSRIRYSMIDGDGGFMTAIVTNLGTRPGAVVSLEIHYYVDVYFDVVSFRPENGVVFLDPSKGQTVRFILSEGFDGSKKSNNFFKEQGKCHYMLKIQDFVAGGSYDMQDFSCKHLTNAIKPLYPDKVE